MTLNNSGTDGLDWYFIPNPSGYHYPGAYVSNWIKSGTWDPSINRYVRGFVRSCYYVHRWHGDYTGFRRERRAVPWDGLALVYRADETPTGWRVRLVTAPKGDKRLPRKSRRFTDPERVSPMPRGF